MMKKIIALGGAVLLFAISAISSIGAAYADPLAAKSENSMILYVGEGCPHCAKVEEYFDDKGYWDLFNIEMKEIYRNADNAKEFNAFGDKVGLPLNSRGVPMLVVGDKYFVGDKPIIEYTDKKYELKKLEEAGSSNGGVGTTGGSTSGGVGGDGTGTENGTGGTGTNSGNENGTGTTGGNNTDGDNISNKLTIPVLVFAALADAVNPCEFAVLIILLTSIIATGAKKRALASGLSFSLAIFLSYFAMGLGLYSVVAAGQFSATFVKIVGSLAILLGLFNLKDFFFYGKGFLMEVPMGWRPKMKALLRSVTGPVGAFFIGILISLFLLPCTSGPYIVVTSLLAQSETFWYAFRLLLLYNVIFVSPMLIITFAVYGGFSVEKAEAIRQKKLRVLHLIAGVLLIAMGVIVWMEF